MWNIQVERLKQLVQRKEETWQGGLIRLAWVREKEGRPFRPWAALWVSVGTRRVHVSEGRRPEEKDYAAALTTLTEFAADENIAGYRPGKVEVSDPGLAEYLAGPLSEAAIEVVVRERLPTFDRLYADLLAHLNGRPPIPGYGSVPGVSLPRVAAFAEAARLFFAARPWSYLTDQDLVEIEAPPAPDRDLRWFTVMGAGGMTYGLGFFASQDQFHQVIGAAHPADFLDANSAWTVAFDEITDVPLADSEWWLDHHLPVPDERTFPFAYKISPGRRIQRPSPSILAFLEGLLRALATMTEDQIDSGRWSVSVPTFDGPKEFTFGIPELREPVEPTEPKKPTPGQPMIDRRIMERQMDDIQRILAEKNFATIEEANEFLNRHLTGKPVPHKKAETPREKAQDLVYRALESRGRRRVQLARKALELDPDCAEAYILRAEQAGDPEKRMEYYRTAMAVAERALGPRYFQEAVGGFWGLIETRPYMRARLGLADTLDRQGQKEEAITHYRELLRLNPNDNQGVRDILLPRLLERGRTKEAQGLLDQYKTDATAMWRYGRTLLAFQRDGDTAEARKALKQALKANPHVPKYLMEKRPLPERWPETYRLGDETEAVYCALDLRAAWKATPGAVEWLARQIEK